MADDRIEGMEGLVGGRLDGKVAIVTGGASGIGLAAVRRLIAEGASVVVGDVDEERLRTVEEELADAVAPRRCDVRSEDDVAALADHAVECFGRLDIAFANAGVGALEPIEAIDVAGWMQVVEINLLGPLLTIKHAARVMDGAGSIIVTASLNAVQPAGGMSAYCCTKAGAVMLVQVAAIELGPRGIRVNAIGPGLVRTALTEAMWLAPEVVEEYDDNAPLTATTTADDVAGLVAFLASDEASSISGSFHLIDRAAHTMRYPRFIGAGAGTH